MDIKKIEGVIEAVLFASGDPVSLNKLSNILGQDKKTLRLIINNMAIKYKSDNRGLMIREIDNRYQMCTKPEFNEYIMQLEIPHKKHTLSAAAYETLAIIAYNQPVTRARIEQIRGVNSDSVILNLQEKNLICEVGREDSPGKPKLYGTTEEFLRLFGFRSLKELPKVEMNEIEEILEDIPVD